MEFEVKRMGGEFISISLQQQQQKNAYLRNKHRELSPKWKETRSFYYLKLWSTTHTETKYQNFLLLNVAACLQMVK